MTELETVARLRISLADVEPEIWRRVDVPLGLTLKSLHDVIQAAMGWLDYHLYQFEIGDRVYGSSNFAWDGGPKVLNASNARIETVLDRGHERWDYLYDFGDCWLHSIAVESIGPAAPDTKYPRFIDGAREAPPEDCGGPPGFELFLEAIGNPGHPEHAEMLDWYGGPFEADTFDALPVKFQIGRIASRRHAGKRKRK